MKAIISNNTSISAIYGNDNRFRSIKSYYPKKKYYPIVPSTNNQLPTNHPMDIHCFQECAVWTLNLSSLYNKAVYEKGQFFTKAVPAQSNDLTKGGQLSSNLAELFPIDLRDNQRFVLDRNQPKMYMNIDFDLFSLNDEGKSFRCVDKEFSSMTFEIDLHASLHQNKMFKDSINFKVKGYDIIKSIQGKLHDLMKRPIYYLSNPTDKIMIYGATVFNDIQCSLAVDFSISQTSFAQYSQSNYHNPTQMGSYNVKIVKMKISYCLPLCIFAMKNYMTNNSYIPNHQMMHTIKEGYVYTPLQPKQMVVNFCNWHSFMSNTTPILYETEEVMVKDILKAFIKPSLFGVNCLYKFDQQVFTQASYFPSLSQIYIEGNDNEKGINCNSSRRPSINNNQTNSSNTNTNSISNTNVNINQINTIGNNDNSTLDGSFMTSTSIPEEKCNITTSNFNSKALKYKEQIAESYNIKSFKLQLNDFMKMNPECEEMTIGDISHESWFSLIWTPMKTPQMKTRTPGMKFIEQNNCLAFEVFYRFRSYNCTNSGHHLEVIGIQEKNIKGITIDTMNNGSEYFWFQNMAVSANQYYFNQDYYMNRSSFAYLKENAYHLEIY